MFFPSAIWKLKAREALKNNWLTALLILLTVNLPSLLVQGIASFTGNDLLLRMQDAIYASMTSAGVPDAQALTEALRAMEDSAGIWLMQGLNVLAWLITPCLALGMYHWMLQRLAGQNAGYSTVFSRMRLFLKSIGLRLYVALRIFLYMLPGVALSVLSLLPVWTANAGSQIELMTSLNTAMTLMTLSSIVMLALGIFAALTYSPAEILMAGRPETRILDAARQSKALMKGNRGQLFSLYVSFILWYLLEIFLANLAMSMFGTVAGLMVQMLCSLALSAYMHTSVCAFCRALTQQGDATESTEDTDPNAE